MPTPDVTNRPAIEWPTLFVCFVCYAGFAISTTTVEMAGPWTAALILALTLTLYSSFSHEVLHGHPFRDERLNTTLVFPAFGLLIPYHRFRDTHLAHHHDPALTDPYDDPESNFIDPTVWAQWGTARRLLYTWNNTLLGRMLVGPLIGLAVFYRTDWRAIWAGETHVRDAYLFHALGLIPVALWLVFVADMPLWLYLLCAYASHSILKIRTFLEHRAHERARCRSVIIEDRGPLAFLFLQNNLHAVHHAHPQMPWYRLKSHYMAGRAGFLARNGGYAYRSYAQVARLFLFRTKDPVPHLLWESKEFHAERTTGR